MRGDSGIPAFSHVIYVASQTCCYDSTTAAAYMIGQTNVAHKLVSLEGGNLLQNSKSAHKALSSCPCCRLASTWHALARTYTENQARPSAAIALSVVEGKKAFERRKKVS